MPEGIEISGLQPTPGVDGFDAVATKKGNEDFRTTLSEIGQYFLDNFVLPEKVLSLIKEVDTNSSGLNSTTLQGRDESFFRNATNLNAGKVDSDLLPGQTITESFVRGGTYNTGRLNLVLPVPRFIFGEKILIQAGYTYFTGDGGNVTTHFSQPFTSGWGADNKPIVFVTPECRADLGGGNPWNNDRNLEGNWDVELDMRLYYSDLTKFQANGIRTSGRRNDQVRANWLAIGKY